MGMVCLDFYSIPLMHKYVVGEEVVELGQQ